MIGGWLADLFQYRRILIFSLIELTTGAFGFFSLGIIDGIGDLIAADSLPRLVATTFIFL